MVDMRTDGDHAGAVELLDQRRHQLEAFCAGFAADPHDRDELVQLVMIRVWRGHDRFDGRAALSTWLFQIVRNTAATEFRRRHSRPVPVDVGSVEETSVPGPEDTVVMRDVICRAMGEVPEPFRATVELVDRWGCRPAEVATAAGVSDATIRTRLHRGRRCLREALLVAG